MISLLNIVNTCIFVRIPSGLRYYPFLQRIMHGSTRINEILKFIISFLMIIINTILNDYHCSDRTWNLLLIAENNFVLL